MAEVSVKKGEPVDRALKRLKNKLENEGILEEIRRLRSFETPTQRTKRKARANAKRSRNRVRFTLDQHNKRDEA
ncbi:MAG: 30S ribosomal protein S21 [Verrucomicrobiales bacterium]|nr:30S ribosomal protein S21 [Verrucomicrobiales bacterium]